MSNFIIVTSGVKATARSAASSAADTEIAAGNMRTAQKTKMLAIIDAEPGANLTGGFTGDMFQSGSLTSNCNSA